MTNSNLPWTPDFEIYPVAHAISSARPEANAVVIEWSDGQRSKHHALWLRENSPDEQTIHPLSRELVVDPLSFPENLSPDTVAVEATGALKVVWSHGGHVSRYHPGWLRTHAWLEESLPDRPDPLELWDAQSRPTPPTFPGQDALNNDTVFLAWLESLRDVGIARLEGLPVRDGLLEQIVSRIGIVRETNFGRLFHVVVKDDPDSNAYTAAALIPHMDLGTRELPPGLQFLYCRENSTAGGQGIYVDGFRIAADMQQEDPENFEDLAGIAWEFKNRATDCDYRATGPVIARDQEGRLTEIRYTPWLRAPLKAPFETQQRAYRSLRAFMQRNSEARYQLRLTYRPGDLVAFANRRVLHGRAAYNAAGGRRFLEGCYSDRDDLLSCIRQLKRERQIAA
ncbi:MAG: TauD/TfdA family dioxygenase [Hyphomicrobiaceae bacterium]